MTTPIRFTSFADVEAALARLDVATAPAGTGVALAHCAQSIELSMTGYPRLKPWLFRATVGKLARRTFLRRGWMKHDTAAPIAGADPIATDTPVGVARSRLRAAIAAFTATAGPPAPHLAYGACTVEQYQRLHAMHIADHWGALGLT